MNFAEQLARERRARLAAERLLEMKQRELLAANQQLADHARALSGEVRAQRDGLAAARCEADRLRDRTHAALDELQRTRSVAEAAERRLWAAIDTIADGFALFDADHRLVAANRAYLAGLGCESPPTGTHVADIILWFARSGRVDMGQETPDDWAARMQARLSADVIEPVVFRIGDRVIRLTDRRIDGGGLVSLAVDLTESAQHHRELEEARRNAEAASRAKSAFLANMSHEIRTPMNGVVGMAELLCESELSDEQRLFAETIRSSGEALLAIINDVLDYSKIEAEKLRLFPEPFDLERCIHEVLILLQPGAREKGLDLLVDFDLFLPTRFVADPGRIRQILMNLVGNAVKFTETGHVLVRVVGMEGPDRRYELHVTVEDTGIGIAPEHLDHIFGEFNQVEDQMNRRYEGTGLGLAITHQLVALMGGSVWVDSEPGKGSCFGFRLLLEAAEPVDHGCTPEPLALGSVMVVDDLLINRVILERQLETCGLTVTTCRSAAEALQLYDGGARFDLVLTDHEMPEVDGPALAAALRSRGVSVPILLLSSSPAAGALEDANLTGVMRKPIARAALFRALREAGGAAAPTAARAMRVLAAEDNRTNQLVFRKMTEGLDMDLTFAENGREAVEIWRHVRPDLIFMDISMPEMDGREAARRIRAEEAAAGLAPVRITALTAHADQADQDEIRAAGIDDVLTKPLKRPEIVQRISAACPAGVRPPQPAETPGTTLALEASG